MENENVIPCRVSPEYFNDADDGKVAFLMECGKNCLAIQEQSRLSIRGRCQTLAVLLASGISAVVVAALGGSFRCCQVHLFLMAAAWGCCFSVLMWAIWSRQRTVAWGAPADEYFSDETVREALNRKLYAVNNSIRDIQDGNAVMGRCFNWSLAASIAAPVLLLIAYLVF